MKYKNRKTVVIHTSRYRPNHRVYGKKRSHVINPFEHCSNKIATNCIVCSYQVSFNGCLFFSSTNSFSFDLVLLVQFKFAEIPLRQCSSPLTPPSPISVSNLTLISFPWWWFQVKTKASIDYQTIGRRF